MASNTESLRELFLDVAGDKTITERQENDRSRDSLGDGGVQLERTVSATVLEDGLDDAVDGAEVEFDAGT
jgi:hypothetical protein